jgi:hypothetical protein
MPLILAIEPDKRQATQLSTVIKRRLDAELILVETTERALDAIGNRMPDLVLVPALLSPQDDAALAAALRVIAAAAHVQMLTIPLLGSAKPAQKSGGVLSALRRGRAKPVETDGCDPAVFAEQIASYLEHLEEERRTASFASAERAPEAVPEQATESPAEPSDSFEEFVADPQVPTPSPSLMAKATPVVTTEDGDRTLDTEPTVFPDDVVTDGSVSLALEEAVRALFSEPGRPQVEVPAEPRLESIAEPDGPAMVVGDPFAAEQPPREAQSGVELTCEPVDSEFDSQPVVRGPEPVEDAAVADTAELQSGHPDVEPVFDESMLVAPEAPEPVAAAPAGLGVTPELRVSAAASPVQDEWEALEELIGALDAMPLAALQATAEDEWIAPVATPPEAPVQAAAPILAAEPMVSEMQPDAAEADAAPAPARSEREWVALIESLRHDVERLRSERAEKPVKKATAHRTPRAEATRPAAAAGADGARSDKKTKPIQDEWGFFDPEQCGFAALLAKLDEVTDSDELVELAGQPRRRQ